MTSSEFRSFSFGVFLSFYFYFLFLLIFHPFSSGVCSASVLFHRTSRSFSTRFECCDTFLSLRRVVVGHTLITPSVQLNSSTLLHLSPLSAPFSQSTCSTSYIYRSIVVGSLEIYRYIYVDYYDCL